MKSILDHSEAKAIFITKKQYEKNKNIFHKGGITIIILDDFHLVNSEPEKVLIRKPFSFSSMQKEIREEDLAAIIYTSGATGSSKGVMLSHKNLCFMVEKTLTIQDVNKNDRFLSILPLSHTYENSLGFLLALHAGASVYYIRRQPTPTILMEAFKTVKPTTILSVPMIIEKIYRKQVIRKFHSSPVLKKLFAFKPTRILLNRMAVKKLLTALGGQIRFFGIGGAKLDPVIEKYLLEGKFPYAIGYGLTETSPLLAGCSPANTKWQSTGNVLEGVQMKIHDPDPVTGEGEIWVKGDNVMKGYYKNPEATSDVFSDDGWFKTGDLARMDEKGYVFIRGRIKNVILGTNGENIYPEEIESVLNGIEGVEESLVVQKHGRLVAMVKLNLQEMEDRLVHLNENAIKVTNDTVDELLSEIQIFVNKKVNRFSRLQTVVLHNTPFEKTPTKKIKRYLYTA